MRNIVGMNNLLGKRSLYNCIRYYSTQKPCEKQTNDVIGPPDAVSNLRPIIFAKSKEESPLERKYRETREATQQWNQNFWSKHNANFVAEREQFRERLKADGKVSLTADEMSVFYKIFLDKNWRTHCRYNFMWYKKNLELLLLEFRIRLSKLKFK